MDIKYLKMSKIQCKGDQKSSLKNNDYQNHINYQMKNNPQNINSDPSEFSQAYRKYIGTNLTIQQKEQVQQKLKNNNVIIEEHNFCSSLYSQIIQTDLESFRVLLHYGIYKLYVNVLMTEFTESFFNCPAFSNGSYGKIYSFIMLDKQYAVKRIMLKLSNFDTEIENVYKEYFLCYIASILKVGPKIVNIFGYDIIVTKDSAFFAMEFCQNYTKLKKQIIKKQMIENLKILHSLKFIHMDIKPPNLAYSFSYQKCVFIDFGLSLLIKNDIGSKTYSNFAGTLSYCSEQMKKTYFLQKPKLIDLYYNDAISLKNTIKKLEYVFDLSEGQQMNEKVNRYQEMYFDVENNQNNQSPMEKSLYYLQFKFYIFSNNFEEITKIISSLTDLPKSFLAIFNNKTTKEIIKTNQTIQSFFSKIISNIMEQKRSGGQADNVISQALERINQNEGIYQFTLSEQILNLSDEKFKIILQNQKFICNVILYLDIFSKQEQKNSQKEKIVLSLLKKMNKILKNESSIEIYEQITNFLIFSNKKLVKKRNYKILSILRMLFIRMEDFKSVQSLEDEIINLITDPILKCLKIAQFSCFWSILLQGFYYKISFWKQIVEESLEKGENERLFEKIKEFTLIIFHKIISQRFADNSSELRIIEQILSDPLTKQFHEQVCINEALSFQFSRIQNTKMVKCSILRVYSTYFSSFKFISTIENSSFFNLFKSCTKYLQDDNFITNPEQHENKLEKSINYTYKLLYGRPDLISDEVLQNLQKHIQQKRLLILFFNKYVQNVQIFCKQIKIFNEFQLFSSQKIVLPLISFLSQDNLEMNDSERKSLMQKICLVLRLCNQKLNSGVKIEYISQINNLKIAQKILEVKYKILKKETHDIESQIQQIFQDINLQNYKERQMLRKFCQILEQIVEKFEGKIKDLFDNLVLKICQNRIEGQNFSLLENGEFTFFHYMRINLSKNQDNKSRNLLQQMIMEIEEKKIKFATKFKPQNSIVIFCLVFCLLSSTQILKNIYEQISFRKEQFYRKCFPYYILSIFAGMYQKQKCQKETMVRQMKRSCLCIERMHPLHALRAKQIILRLCNLQKIVESRRKKLICERMEIRISEFFQQSLPIRLDLEILNQETKKIKNKKVKHCILEKKIFL